MAVSEFVERRAEIQALRRQLEDRQERLFLTRERSRQLVAGGAELDRVFDPDDEVHQRQRAELRVSQERIAERTAELEAAARDDQVRLGELLEAFAALTDPRARVSQLDDRIPVLLLPLRLETRFRRLTDDAGTRHELWVRVYPDDCAVDTFEESLTEAEVRHARLYWARIWAAGDRDAERRAAWRELATAHGSGRAMWIVERYRPLNEAAQPARPPAGLILVIMTDTPLSAAAQAAAATFWEAFWRAGDDASAIDAARAALRTTVGADEARSIEERYRPINLGDPPPADQTPETTDLIVATVEFATPDAVATRRSSWSRGPRVKVMPDRLVLLGYVGAALTIEELGEPIPSPLIVGPDPLAPPATQGPLEGDELVVNDDILWMVDFDEAVRRGMGFQVSLDAEAFDRGFDRLVVLGVRLSSDEDDGRLRCEELLANHHHSRAGLTLLPHGAPTNNTEEQGAAPAGGDDPDLSYDIMTGAVDPFDPAADWFARRDGQWLATWLGVSPELLSRVLHADGTDVAEAQAMNAALWPATIGYFMDTMMSRVFDDGAVELTRQFFTQFVSGRGMCPAVRVGKQPYGVLPVTAYSRMGWPPADGPFTHAGVSDAFGPFATRLHQIAMRAYRVWGDLERQASWIGKEGDPHQILLDILGLHATSVEYHTRYAESLALLVNYTGLQGLPELVERLMQEAFLQAQGTEILQDHGYNVAAQGRLDLLDKFFLSKPTRLEGDVIDDQPLSERSPIRPYTTDGRNYITWLVEAGRTSLEAVRRQEGFIDNKRPSPLLYLMLRHAVMLGYYDTSLRLYEAAGAITADQLRLARTEANFIHIADRPHRDESRWHLLYRAEPAVTGGGSELLVADFIPQVLEHAGEAARLRDQLAALDVLQTLPTARLERLFAEHLDVCSYRLDAWIQGLVSYQLARMRFSGDAENGTRRGLYLGAYGWVEDVRPRTRPLEPVELADESLREIFQAPGDPPLQYDRDNAGYIHSPSLNHAVTAAVLRNGYLSNASDTEPKPFAVNLSSERVRRALAVIEGMHGGQSLSALLGYQFERGLHDRHGQAEVDKFIYPLRKAFPLRADHLADTATDETVPIEAIEARNVLDGVDLAEHVQSSGLVSYPFGIAWLPSATPTQAAVIDEEVERLLDTRDAVADLGIAEAVHQVVQGNFDRAAATINAFSKGELPSLPDVALTPRSGIGLTHRVALHLRPGFAPTDSPHAGIAATPRASAEPALNHWLASVFPSPDRVAVVVHLRDGTVNATVSVTQEELGLQPIDMLFLLDPVADQAMSALDDAIIRHFWDSVRPDGTITIAYTERLPDPNQISMFELSALTSDLRSLLLAARPLRATDPALPNEAGATAVPPPTYRPARLSHIRDALQPPVDALQQLVSDLEPLLADPSLHRDDLVTAIDDHLNRFVAALAILALHGLPQTGTGFALDWKRQRYAALLKKIEDLDDRWQARLDRFDELMTDYLNLPATAPDEVRYARLEEIESQVATARTDPRPATPADYVTVVNARRAASATKRAEFTTILGTATPDLAVLFAAIAAAAGNLDQFDYVRLELDEDVTAVVLMSQDILAAASALIADVAARITIVNDSLDIHSTSADTAAREAAFLQAGAALLGEDFPLIPEFVLPAPQADELQKAYDARATLLDHSTTNELVDFPVDEWLYGIARVRERMAWWESTTMLAGALGGAEPALEPVQLPYGDAASWLALPFPPETTLAQDYLLYTAHWTMPFVKTDAQCGLLLDEWTEVIPVQEETTGVSFHFDRPNAEPPQLMLLVAPAVITGAWAWEDLVDSLHETLDLAKRRAVEPDHIAATTYGRFLPATITATTVHPITIALNLALNNDVFAYMENRDGNG